MESAILYKIAEMVECLPTKIWKTTIGKMIKFEITAWKCTNVSHPKSSLYILHIFRKTATYISSFPRFIRELEWRQSLREFLMWAFILIWAFIWVESLRKRAIIWNSDVSVLVFFCGLVNLRFAEVSFHAYYSYFISCLLFLVTEANFSVTAPIAVF